MARFPNKIKQAFAANGLLAEQLPNFSYRQAQQQLAHAIARNHKPGQRLVAEAGTGTGKTFAYLLPALLSGKRVAISTGTKNLQDQLFFKDLPSLLPLLDSGIRVALLKGRSNYLCHYHLHRHLADTDNQSPIEMDQLIRIRSWANGTGSGDMAEMDSLAEDAPILRKVTSTHDNCLGRKCPEFDRCFLKRARAKAMAADLVVINHHLFFADSGLKEGGFGELLPELDWLIFDEAHQLPDIALNRFGERLTSSNFHYLARDIRRLYQQLKDCKSLDTRADDLQRQADELSEALHANGAPAWLVQLKYARVTDAMAELEQQLQGLHKELGYHLGRDELADLCFERCARLMGLLAHFAEPDASQAYTLERRKQGFALVSSPLSVRDKLTELYQQYHCAWAFTSATLQVAGDFGYFTRQMALDDAETLILDSPFDYPRQALLCVPRGLPEPHEAGVADHLAAVANELIEAADGRTFLLFTSYHMMHQVGERLSRRQSRPLLVQGMDSKRQLLSRFHAYGNAVLLGTSAFWEGVDVRGRGLCCVMIDKLPFVSPDDPLTQARVSACQRSGQDPFSQVQLPQAILALKQGVGRLIRSEQDQGVLVISDPRLVHRPYGEQFIASLPAMARTRELDNALARLREV
ncbi:ATP-dependent DNA helicase [Ferrimonas kyonanensis]|uniref:ATP-dependent DNA helicase n=1 Tax=Ferrimonas kyonanensis TaxID=364763 RepID=UPI000417FFC7|nr:ATP-dependent DNA helicase [Ferrimonas kyonanensis]